MGLGANRIAGAAVTLGAAWVVAPGCGGSTRIDGPAATPDCPAGSEGCPCRDGEECDGTLTCATGTCVEENEDAGQVMSEDAGQVVAHPCPLLEPLAESRFHSGVVCAWEAVEAQRLDTNLLLVMDASASLAEEVSGTGATRWELLSGALAEALTESGFPLHLGLVLVPDTAGLPSTCDGAPAECCGVGAADGLTIPIGPSEQTLPAIVGAMEARRPAGASPVAAALERAYEHLVDGGVSGNRYVLLATDGGANCNHTLDCDDSACTLHRDPSESCSVVSNTCCRAGPGGCLDDTEVTAQIERLLRAGVHTIVVGVAGNDQYAAALGRWADAGDVERPDGSVGYFEVTVESEVTALVQAFQYVTPHVSASCDVPLDDPPLNPWEVLVAVDCEPIPRDLEAGDDAASWWIFNHADETIATAIILEGAVCERIQTEGVWRVDVAFGCPAMGGIY